MSIEEKVQLALTVLLTGLVIVFVMLIFLTFIIKGYGAIVRSLESKMKEKKAIQVIPAQKVFVPAAKNEAVIAQDIQEGISGEVVAAITAAVYMMYGTSVSTVTSIRRAAEPNRSVWGMAGLLENTRPF